ncbi:MAG TPA: hypothetical protein VFQ61_20465 [Polyangiaceae bacterium]|nr:hypothetical protein [Polyangiaceae bacterium]
MTPVVTPEPPSATYEEEEDPGRGMRAGALPELEEIRLAKPEGVAFGLDGYGGIAVLSRQSTGASHAYLGGLARVRVGYLQFGGSFEQSDVVDNEWRTIGGFVGAFFPFHNWVDFDAAVGFASRRHASSDGRYGPDGYNISMPAMTLRFGVSDRTSESLSGVRVGAYLMTTIDLKQRRVPWSFSIENSSGEEVVTTGSSRVGGFSIGGAFALGFDIVPGAHDAPPVPPKSAEPGR